MCDVLLGGIPGCLTKCDSGEWVKICQKQRDVLYGRPKRRFPEDVLLSSANVLNVQLWPEDEGERLLYGDKEVAFLAKLAGFKYS